MTGDISLSRESSTNSIEYEPSKKEDSDRGRSKKKRMFLEVEDDNDSGLPMKYRHVRISERIVKEEFYQTIASLIETKRCLEQN